MLNKKRTEAELLDEMKRWYNGYRFSTEDIRVYNPFSLIYYLKDQYLANYWFASGTTSFLVKLLKKNPTLLVGIEDQIISASSLGSFDIGCMPDITLFYQTGYLTIKSYERMCDTDPFTLGFPNEEVKRSLSILMMGVLTYREKAVVKGICSVSMALVRNDMDTFCAVIKHILLTYRIICMVRTKPIIIRFCKIPSTSWDWMRNRSWLQVREGLIWLSKPSRELASSNLNLTKLLIKHLSRLLSEDMPKSFYLRVLMLHW